MGPAAYNLLVVTVKAGGMSGDQNQARGEDGRFVARGGGGELDSDDGGETGSVGVQDDGVPQHDAVPQPTAEEQQRWREEQDEFRARTAEQLERLVSGRGSSTSSVNQTAQPPGGGRTQLLPRVHGRVREVQREGVYGG